MVSVARGPCIVSGTLLLFIVIREAPEGQMTYGCTQRSFLFLLKEDFGAQNDQFKGCWYQFEA